MSKYKKIEYYNLREEVSKKKLKNAVGRVEEMERLTRVVGRRLNNNALVVGPGGIGKTALIYGWIKKMSENSTYEAFQFIQLDADHFHDLDAGAESPQDALENLPACVLFVDNFGHAIYNNPSLVQLVSRLYKSALKEPEVRVIFTLETHEYAWLEREYPGFVQLFETIHLKNQSSSELTAILQQSVPHLNEQYRVIIPTDSLEEVVSYAERFPVLGQLPQSAISLLDEVISLAGAKGRRMLNSELILQVVGGKTGIPTTQLTQDDLETLSSLEEQLSKQIINQESAVAKITTTLQRGKLGLRNPNKPLGSFLMLGPSGVGKTETAKVIAQTLFGRSESFIRFDMSEFQQEHTIQRLIGAPVGYMGYEEGGALTNALRREPHCIILLDEIEKAHPKVFDIFLQVLDDGRITSGQNETVDARNAIIMATSNVGVEEILKGTQKGIDVNSTSFLNEKMMPELAASFRLEFINRFDSVLVFNPLTIPGLVQIAQLEVKKIERRLSKHKVKFEIDSTIIEDRIRQFADPRFGARPVKRFIEETCESLLMQSLLKKAVK
jgi:ATP-dependent Clp protease ATP-binding subunit ClpA